MSTPAEIERIAREREELFEQLKEACKAAQANFVTDVRIAEAAGVTVQTIRRWTGKDR